MSRRKPDPNQYDLFGHKRTGSNMVSGEIDLGLIYRTNRSPIDVINEVHSRLVQEHGDGVFIYTHSINGLLINWTYQYDDPGP